VLNADADTLFTRDSDTQGLWSRLLRMARTVTAAQQIGNPLPTFPAAWERRPTVASRRSG
jgi:hypothetical protein